MTARPQSELVMGFHPTARGFGWVIFDGGNELVDWGLAYVRGDKNAASLRYLKLLLERFRPHVVILEQFDRKTGQRACRVARLCQAVATLARDTSIEVCTFTRAETRNALGLPARSTRQEVAEAVALGIETLRHRLPRYRKPWESVDRRLALFCAAALVMAHLSSGG